MYIYVNGEYYAEDQAKVSVLDHGFLYGDAVFETLTVTKGRVFKLEEHVNRLYASAAVIKIEIPMSKEEMKAVMLDVIQKNNAKDSYMRVIVSRGPGYPLLDPRVCLKPTVVVMLHAKTLPPSIAATYAPQKEGLKVITTSVRKTPSVCLESRVKSCNYLNNILARMEATQAGANEAIMLDINNFVSEGSGENVFIVKDGALYTPYTFNVLAGITRQTIIELAEEEGIKVHEKNLTKYDLYTADEAFFTSTAGGVMPIAEIDGRKIGTERPGPITMILKSLYDTLIITEGTEV